MPLRRVRGLRETGRQDTDSIHDARAETDLGPLPGLIGYVLRRAQVAVFQDFIETFAQKDIRPAQFSALAVIEHNPGLNQSRLASVLGIKRANLVGMLDELEARGLAVRRPNSDDRRAHGLYLTDKGAAVMRELHALVAEHEQRMVARVGKRGKDQLLLLLHQLFEVAPADTDEGD